MSFGFSPKYVEELPFKGFSTEHLLVLLIEAAKQLDWNIGYTGQTGFVAYTKYSMTSGNEEVKVKIEEASVSLKSETNGNQMFDWGKNKRNIENLIAEFDAVKLSLTPEQLEGKYQELKPELIPDADFLNNHHSTTKEKLTSVFAIFTPTKGYFITPIIININIIIFILMVISGVDFMSPDNQSLLKWGANFRPLTLEGEWWRLITNTFLHIGILHLLLNMYALLYIGLLLEPYLGKARFLAAYLLTGIAASTTSLYWHDFTLSAGASGAIFGMYGVFLAMLTTNFIEKSARRSLLTSIGIFVAYNLMNGMKGGIDNAAHIGGLVSGLIIGYAYYPSLKEPEAINLKRGTIGGLSFFIISVCFLTCRNTPNDIAKYDTKIKSLVSMESMALEVYRMPKNTPKNSLLSEIKDRGIYYWRQNIELINDLDKLNLPDELHDRDRILIHYCNLRIKSYNLLYKAVNEGNNNYKDSIATYNTEIEATIDSLKGK